MEKPCFNHSLSLTADSIWSMEDKHCFTPDVESHYRGMLNLIDVLTYRNGESFYGKVKTRHAVYFLALAMPSFACIDPHRTREMKYNLHCAALALENEALTDVLDPYDSQQMRKLEIFVTLAMYKLVSEKKINDARFHRLAEEIFQRAEQNSRSEQKVFAYDTIQGTYQVYPNAAMLLAFKIHDNCFGTRYGEKAEERVLTFIREVLTDEKTGLYRNFYKTGSLGVSGEYLSRQAAWVSTTPDAAANALAVTFVNLFDPCGAQRAWATHKEVFSDRLLSFSAQDLTDERAGSYLSPLPPSAEALYSSLLAAKEMDDKMYFERLQKRIMAVAGPDQREGKIFLDALGQDQKLHGDFLSLARVHLGWKKLMDHDWKAFYGFDYAKVR